MVVAWLVSLFVGSTATTVGFLIASVAAIYGLDENWKVYPREFADWNNKYICMRCSNVFSSPQELMGQTDTQTQIAQAEDLPAAERR